MEISNTELKMTKHRKENRKMKPNDFDTNISIKHSKTFSTRMRILLFLALLMTGLISIVGIIQIVKERIEGGANEKAVLRLFINCPFVCINFDFFWLNKARQLYMDF